MEMLEFLEGWSEVTFCIGMHLASDAIFGGREATTGNTSAVRRLAPCYMSLKTSVLRLQLSTVTGTPLTGLLLSQTLVLLL